jgi:hypothetical protein
MILGDGTEVRMGNTYGQGEVGDERGSEEMDRCPLIASSKKASISCKGNLTNLRRELHLSLAKGNPKRTL